MRIPLFPLNLVLFPGQTLPLHIFEERYKAMLKKCVAEQIPFGLVLVRENSRLGRGTPHAIGTYAVVTKVEEIPEGTCVVPAQHRGNCYHIICRGDERFRVTALDRREAEYLVGDVDTYPDEPAPAPALAMVAQRVTEMFDDYYRHVVALMGGWQRPSAPGETDGHVRRLRPRRRSEPRTGGRAAHDYRPGPACRPSRPLPRRGDGAERAASVKQDLLEAPSALARLQKEAEILAEETPQLDERLSLQMRRRFSAFGMSS